jgi:catechol 2,3-dioxygenase-like lactoylglutathione lyase family enzyme
MPREPHLRGAVHRSAAPAIRPSGLSHVLLFTPDLDRQQGFYIDVPGLGLSDRSRDAIAFTHGRYGSDHHLVAFANSTAKDWHPSS